VALLATLSALPTGARAGDCPGETRAEFAAQVAAARDALFNEDLEALAQTDSALVTLTPCLEAVVDPAIWASHLITISIAAFSSNDDWQAPLDSALSADPAVDRVVGQAHPIARWSPPEISAGSSSRAPSGARLYLDGRQVRYLGELWGPHLLQAQRDDTLLSVYVVSDGGQAGWSDLLAALDAAAPAPQPALTAPPPLGAPPLADAPAPEPAIERSGPGAFSWILVGTGAAMTLGGATIAASTASNANQGVETISEWDAYVKKNNRGWTLGTAGVVVGGLGTLRVVRRTTAVSVSANQLRVVVSL